MKDHLHTAKEFTEKTRKKRRPFQQLTTLFILGVFLFSAYKLGSFAKEYYDNRQVLAEAQAIYLDSHKEDINNNGEPRSQFNHLLDINKDIVGWIEVEGTIINYPILQSKDNAYYLHHNYLKEEERAGSIYLDYRNDIREFSKNNVIYGHRMKDGSMFGQLKKYLNQNFYNKHSIILFDTLYGSYELEIFAAYKTTTDFYYIQTDFSSDEDFLSLIDEIQNKSDIQSDVEITANDQIITLSTCDDGLDGDNGRMVVHAKLKKIQ
ncbi:class B sortase [Viridibacillus arvi]|uniref:class B sortase n=1 Tax=Viridibacillus arvi TaxID=263475 RepID=UPI003D04CFC7